MKLEFPREIFEKYSKSMKMRPVGIISYGQTDGQTNMTKLTVAILSFSKAPDKQRADHHGRAAWAWACGRSLAGTGRFESRRGHGCLSLIIIVCCQVDASETDRSLVQKSPTKSSVSEYDLETSPIRRPRHTRTVEPWKINKQPEANDSAYAIGSTVRYQREMRGSREYSYRLTETSLRGQTALGHLNVNCTFFWFATFDVSTSNISLV